MVTLPVMMAFRKCSGFLPMFLQPVIISDVLRRLIVHVKWIRRSWILQTEKHMLILRLAPLSAQYFCIEDLSKGLFTSKVPRGVEVIECNEVRLYICLISFI